MTVEDLQPIFEKYDKNNSGAIEVEELRTMLSDMGLLKNKTLAEMDSFVVQQFASADSDKDSKLNYQEFSSYYSKVTAPKLSKVLAQQLPDKVDQLKQVFLAFANFGSRQTVEDMDGAKFSKLCKDVKLVGKGLSSTDVDLIFVKVKARTERRITFDQFIQALNMCGEKKGIELPDVVDHILESDGPITHATKAEFVKFHDDKTTYTGVHARGGPLTVDIPEDLASMVRRESSSKTPLFSPPSTCGSRTPRTLTPNSSFLSPAHRARASIESGDFPIGELRAVFSTFATFGQIRGSVSPSVQSPTPAKLEMDNVRFAKLCRDSGLLGGKLNNTAVDLCFAKVKPKGVRKINYKQFMEAIELLAQKKGVSVEEVKDTLAACEGPMLNSVTKADYVKFHDDKSTYTGVHVNGGPTTTNENLSADKLFQRDVRLQPIPSPLSPQA